MNWLVLGFMIIWLIVIIVTIVLMFQKPKKIEGFELKFRSDQPMDGFGMLDITWDEASGTLPISYHWRIQNKISDKKDLEEKDWGPWKTSDSPKVSFSIEPEKEFYIQVYASNLAGDGPTVTKLLTSPKLSVEIEKITVDWKSDGIQPVMSDKICFTATLTSELDEPKTTTKVFVTPVQKGGQFDLNPKSENYIKIDSLNWKICGFSDTSGRTIQLVPGHKLQVHITMTDPKTNISVLKFENFVVPGTAPTEINGDSFSTTFER